MTKAELAEKIKASKSNSNWRDDIIGYLKKHNGATDIEIYKATRPDRLNISERKMKNNVASQMTYLKDDLVLIENIDSRRYLRAYYDTKTKKVVEVKTKKEVKTT